MPFKILKRKLKIPLGINENLSSSDEKDSDDDKTDEILEEAEEEKAKT